MKKLTNLNIIPIFSYENIDENKYNIYEDNRTKSGIYCFNNKITNKIYIGSAKSLNTRLSTYFSLKTMQNKLKGRTSLIYNAILKYGYSNFNLYILEHCESDFLIKREQYYINLLDPEYNLCKVANSQLGRKHSAETLLKYKNRKLSLEAINNLKKAKAGIAPTSSLRRINHLLATGHITSVTNILNNNTKLYASKNEAARDLKVSKTTIANYINSGKLLNNIYLLTKNKI